MAPDRLREIALVCCDHCHLVYYKKYPDCLNDLYTNDYRKESEFDGKDRKKENIVKNMLWESFLKPHLGEGKKVLDIGCSEGFWLKFLKDKYKMDVYGCELTKISVDYGRKNGLNIYDHDVKQLKDPTFDLCFNSGYIEHVEDPRADLEHIWNNILKPGGLLYIQTPNALSPNRDYLSEFFAIEHLQTFTIETLSALLNAVGFTVLFSKDDVYNFGFTIVAKKNDHPGQDVPHSTSDIGHFSRLHMAHLAVQKKETFAPISDFLSYKSLNLKQVLDLFHTNHEKYTIIMKMFSELDADFQARVMFLLTHG